MTLVHAATGGRTDAADRHRRGASSTSDGVFLISIAALGVLVPAWVWDTGGSPGMLGSLLQLAVVVYAALKISLILRRGLPRWLDAMFWSFSYIWIGLAGLAQMTAATNPYNVTLSSASYEKSAAITLVGFAAYEVGRHSVVNTVAPAARVRRVVSQRRVAMLAITAMILTPVLIYRLGGPSAFLVSRYERTGALAASGLLTDSSKVTGGILLALTNALPLVALLGVIALLQQQPALRRHVSWVAAGGVLALLAVFVGNPVSNPRFWTGTIILSVMFSLRWANTPRGFRTVMTTTFAALLVVFPYADLFRYSSSRAVLHQLNYLLVHKLDYDASVQMVNAIDFRASTGGTHGHQILGVLGFFVPRRLWLDKPGATGSLLSDYVGFPQTNVSSPLWVEAYVDGGVLAVIAAFLLLGAFVRWTDFGVGRPLGQPVTFAALAMPVVAAYSIIMLRGSLLSGIGALVVLGGLCWWLTTRRRLGSAPPPVLRTPGPAQVSKVSPARRV